MDHVDTVVIGAGHAGLGVSHELAAAGIDHVVLERGRIGETWRSQRWATFRLNTPNWMNRLPGEADPGPGSRDAFQSAPEFAERLEAYASRHGLPVHGQTRVTRVEASGEGLAIDVVEDGTQAPSRIGARSVIVASGIQNVGRTPAVAGELPDDLTQLHALDYRAPGDLQPGAVLVVGAGQTGGQLVEDLLNAGRPVFWSTSKVARCPRRYRGRDMLHWLVLAGFYDLPVEQLPDPAMRLARQPLISGTGLGGHTLSIQSLAERGAVLVGRIRWADGHELVIDDTVGECIRFGDAGAASLRQIADAAIDRLGDRVEANADDPADQPFPDPDAVRTPDRLDLRDAGVRTVIWATGVGGDFGWLPPVVLDADGAPVHEAGVTAIPGLFVAGFPWLTNRGSGIIYGAGGDARRIAALAAARSTT